MFRICRGEGGGDMLNPMPRDAHNIKSESFTKTSILIYVADKPLLPESNVNTELKLIIAPSQMLPPRSPSSCTCISSGIGPVFGITTKLIKSQVRSDL
jgi:hypothetical protein